MSPIPLSYNDKFEEINQCTESQRSAIDEIQKNFELNTKKLNEIIKHFRHVMNLGLEKHRQGLYMIPSYGNLLI
jgi:hexokinase